MGACLYTTRCVVFFTCTLFIPGLRAVIAFVLGGPRITRRKSRVGAYESGRRREASGSIAKFEEVLLILFTLRMRPRSLWTGPIKIKPSYGLKLYMFIYYAFVGLHDNCNCMFILYALWHDNLKHIIKCT